MHKVIFDCDNTMGIKGNEVDDGLALLYLLGRKDVDILGLTTTFGNSDGDTVYKATVDMVNSLNLNIPIYKGAKDCENRYSNAAAFLAKQVKENPGEITVLGLGSPTNLLGAYEIYPNFFRDVKDIVLMGGITKPLIINNKNLNELNFSCDPLATYEILSSGANVTVLSGHICLQAIFSDKEYERVASSNHPIYKYINENIIPWGEYMKSSLGVNGFYNWDTVAAIYITNPELFEDNIQHITSTLEDLQKGYLKLDVSNQGYPVNIPSKINNIDKFNEVIFKAWETL